MSSWCENSNTSRPGRANDLGPGVGFDCCVPHGRLFSRASRGPPLALSLSLSSGPLVPAILRRTSSASSVAVGGENSCAHYTTKMIESHFAPLFT